MPTPPSQYTLDFSHHLRAYMDDNGVTTPAVADALGRVQSYVSEHTNGKRAPDTDLIAAVAALSGVTAYQLVQEIQARMRGAGAAVPQGRRSVPARPAHGRSRRDGSGAGDTSRLGR